MVSMETIDADDYRDLATVSDPRVSPDGERVAFVRTVPDGDEEYEATVHVVPLGGGDARQFTVSDGVDADPRWSPSGDRLAFASTRGEGDRQQLWVMPGDGGEARRLTSVVGGVSGVAWGPDGERIAFTQRVSAADREAGRDHEVAPEYDPDPPDPRVIDRTVYRAGAEYLDGRWSQVYLLDLGDGSVRALTTADRHAVSPSWGDGDALYYAQKRGEDPDETVAWDLIEHDVAADERGVVGETTGWQPRLAAAADGRLAHTYTPEERASMRQTEVRVLDGASGDPVTLTAGLDRTVERESALHWDPDGERVYFLTPDEGSVVLRRVPGDGSGDPEVVAGEGGHVAAASVGDDLVTYVQSEWDHPGDVFATTPAGAERRRLTRTNADYLDGRAVAQPEEIRFERDGTELQGWLLTPPGADGGEYPLVVEVHGGPHVMWSTGGTVWHEFQTLAARGYAVFWCNPRGSTGYGEAFAEAIAGDWGDATLGDVLAGVDEAVDRDAVDADRQFVTGGSFGGYLTAWALAETDRFDAGVAQRGVYDLVSFYGSSDAHRLVEWEFDAVPWEDPETLYEHSPAIRADGIDVPTLVLHADRDYRVPAGGAELLFRTLRKRGVDTRMVRYPREGHELSRSGEPAHVVDRIERIARWFDGYGGGDVPPALERERNAGLSADDEGGDGGASGEE
jgi:dipeptidyl aminopeptidase/acylaminoacyl peptidase